MKDTMETMETMETKEFETIELGKYPQTADGGVQKILWRVLEKKAGHLLCLSEYVIEHRKWRSTPNLNYPRTGKPEDICAAITPWSKSELRKFLNREFYDAAFDDTEKKRIVERINTKNGAFLHKDYLPRKGSSKNINALTDDTYEKYEERGCADTKDRVFIPNVEEMLKFFGKSEHLEGTKLYPNTDRIARATDYVLKRGCGSEVPGDSCLSPYTANIFIKGEQKHFPEMAGGVSYWLRNLGANDAALNNAEHHYSQVAAVWNYGAVIAGGVPPFSSGFGVRPMILISDLRSNYYV